MHLTAYMFNEFLSKS